MDREPPQIITKSTVYIRTIEGVVQNMFLVLVFVETVSHVH